MKIAIIGAGPSGLVTAAVLQRFGHDVIVFEKAPDIGGVWSSIRAYPGVTTAWHAHCRRYDEWFVTKEALKVGLTVPKGDGTFC